MAEIERKKLGFNAYFGLEEMAVTRTEFKEALDKRIEVCLETNFSFLLPDRETEIAYKKIQIADTFFSDSFPRPSLKRLFDKARELKDRARELKDKNSNTEEVEIQFEFLLINPFSDLARIRAAALEEEDMGNVYWRMNTGLRNILIALDYAGDTDEFQKHKSTIEYLEEQLGKIIEAQEIHPFEVRFTSEYTDLPCYLIGPYALKGVIFPATTARLNPWWVYVDDPTESNDSYSKHQEALDGLWSNAKPADRTLDQVRREKQKRRTIFISWGGRSDNVKRVIFDEIQKKAFDASVKFKPIDFETVHAAGSGSLIPEIYQRGIEQSVGAIVLLLAEDEVALTNDGGQVRTALRARQNVVHELGYVQKAFPPSNVLIVKEEGIDEPSNLGGKMVFVAKRAALDKGDSNLKLRINSFLDNLKDR